MYININNVAEEACWRLNGQLREVVDTIVPSPYDYNYYSDAGVRLALLAIGGRLEEAYAVVFGLYGFINGQYQVDYMLFSKDFVDHDWIKVYRHYSLLELVVIFRNFLKGRSPLYKYFEEGLLTKSEYDLYLLFAEKEEMLSPFEVLRDSKREKFIEVYKRLELYL